METERVEHLEEQIAQWRGYMRHGRAINSPDREELERQLRDQVASLVDVGLEFDPGLPAAQCLGATGGT